MTEKTKLSYALELLSPAVRAALLNTSRSEREKISELRLRLGRYFSAVLYSKEYFVTRDGRFMSGCENAAAVTAEDISYTFTRAFRGSVHSFPRELAMGYITCSGGNRVGFCGTAVLDPERLAVTSIKNVSSINIRIAREIIGCAEPIYKRAFSEGLTSLIIAAPPGGGKTTVLRDLARMLGSSHRVCVIDERGELACMHEGAAQNDVGVHTDVFYGYDRESAVSAAVRVMSPEIIICDEIGAKSDVASLEYALNSGVRLVCTCHAASIEELKKRPAAARLLKDKVFDCAAILGTGTMCGRLTAFYNLK